MTFATRIKRSLPYFFETDGESHQLPNGLDGRSAMREIDAALGMFITIYQNISEYETRCRLELVRSANRSSGGREDQELQAFDQEIASVFVDLAEQANRLQQQIQGLIASQNQGAKIGHLDDFQKVCQELEGILAGDAAFERVDLKKLEKEAIEEHHRGETVQIGRMSD